VFQARGPAGRPALGGLHVHTEKSLAKPGVAKGWRGFFEQVLRGREGIADHEIKKPGGLRCKE